MGAYHDSVLSYGPHDRDLGAVVLGNINTINLTCDFLDTLSVKANVLEGKYISD